MRNTRNDLIVPYYLPISNRITYTQPFLANIIIISYMLEVRRYQIEQHVKTLILSESIMIYF